MFIDISYKPRVFTKSNSCKVSWGQLSLNNLCSFFGCAAAYFSHSEYVFVVMPRTLSKRKHFSLEKKGEIRTILLVFTTRSFTNFAAHCIAYSILSLAETRRRAPSFAREVGCTGIFKLLSSLPIKSCVSCRNLAHNPKCCLYVVLLHYEITRKWLRRNKSRSETEMHEYFQSSLAID